MNHSAYDLCCSEVKVYNTGMDSTLPSVPKKRKHDEVEESPAKTPKKIKTDREAGKKISNSIANVHILNLN